mmetsp:Transcript_37468/g.63830  ORF Transcript_37468/g.63830 Transcript_37468/m.63830 type:complete len:304 (-) Transcript_37468:326-1237(-)
MQPAGPHCCTILTRIAASSLSVSSINAWSPSANFAVAQKSLFINNRNAFSSRFGSPSFSSAREVTVVPRFHFSLHSAAAVEESNCREMGASHSRSLFSSPGGMVIRSTPARASISSSSKPGPRLGRHEAGMTMVPWCPKRLKYLNMSATATTPGSLSGSTVAYPSFALCQSKIRPVKGEMRRAPACAHATACATPNTSVRLQVTPSSFSKARLACTPSHVAASLIRTRARGTPAASYMSIMRLARLRLSLVSKLSLGSTSVDTNPGTSLLISTPRFTARRSIARNTRSSSPPPPNSDELFAFA